MRKLTFLLAIALLGLSMVVMTSQVTFAQDEDNEGKEPPACSELANAESLSGNIESDCHVPAIRDKREAVHPLNKKYENAMPFRRGSTNRNSSESWSDLIEDRIKVRGLYYAKHYYGSSWPFRERCADYDEWGSHVACATTYLPEYKYHKQKSYHQFQTSGFVDQDFRTSSFWTR